MIFRSEIKVWRYHMGTIRRCKSKDRLFNGQRKKGQKDKQCSTQSTA